MSANTPGPWVATTDGWISAALPTLDKLRIAKAALVRNADSHGGFTGDEVTRANELLIAAAPDLLEALRKSRGYVAGAYDYTFPDGDTNTAVLAEVNAAIAKAEGAK